MDHGTPRLTLTLSFCLLLPFVRAQDGPMRFVCKQPIFRIAVDDLPGLLSALPGTHLGRLFAEPDVAAAFATALAAYAGKVDRWSRALASLQQLEPNAVGWEDLAEKDLYALDWRSLRSGELIAACPAADRPVVQVTMLVEPLPAAEGRLAATFASMADRAGKAHQGDGAQASGSQQIDGLPARVISAAEKPARGNADGAWFLHLPGQFAAGTGDPKAAGGCQPKAPPAPGITFAIDIVGYARLLSGLVGETAPIQQAFTILGVDAVGPLTWHIEPRGELVHEDLFLEYHERPRGLLGALLDGMAPLVGQPLPEHGLLQLRCAFDVPALVKVANELLALSGMQTLGELGLEEDLNKAWTGGMALAVARPAAGGLVPRIYASFGIVDEAALGRLLARLAAETWIKTKDVTYEGEACVQLRPEGAPPALQPTYCIRNGTIHFAESGLSLRAMLKASAAGAPPALDVGTAPRPEGKGAVMPSFDLRFDGAAIHAAIQELWLPLWSTMVSPDGRWPSLLPLSEMPDVETVTAHLQKGRGVLRRLPDRIVLGMTGTAGGPELQAILTTFGPMMSGEITSSWSWRTDALTQQIVTMKLGKVHAAIAAFTQRTGKRPESLAELVTSEELKDRSLLLVEGDEMAEAVVKDGVELGKSSYRYYRDGIKVSPLGEEITAHLIAVKHSQEQRLAVDLSGTVHAGYGEFALKTIDQLERKN